LGILCRYPYKTVAVKRHIAVANRKPSRCNAIGENEAAANATAPSKNIAMLVLNNQIIGAEILA